MMLLARIVSLIVFLLSPPVFSSAEEKKTAVLVTGASSGIGLRITELLSENGYLVYAGARDEKDLKRLQAMDNVESIRLDVTVASDIQAAVEHIARKGHGLYGIVNNAGISMMGPLIEVPVEELEWLFNVNVYGPYRITQAFAPMVIESEGRIVNISSITGIYSGALNGHYSMSKHAIEAYTDSLAAEMERFGVKVSAIEPGNFASSAGKSALTRLQQKAYWNENSAYKDELVFLTTTAAREPSGEEPDDVAKAVMHALFAENPKRRYLVASARTTNTTIGKAMERVLQLNQDQPYTKSKEQLVKTLDRQLLNLKNSK